MDSLYRRQSVVVQAFRPAQTADLKVRTTRRLEHLVPGVKERRVQSLHSHKGPGPGGTMPWRHDGGEPEKGRKQDRGKSAGREESSRCQRRQDVDQNKDGVRQAEA